MRKLVMSLSVLAGLLFAGTIPASANAAAGLTAVQVPSGQGVVTQARWHHGWGHRGWGGLYFGFGPYWGFYPRHRYYYYDDDYYYYRPYYYYGGHRWHHHHRYWGGHGHWRGHGHHHHW